MCISTDDKVILFLYGSKTVIIQTAIEETVILPKSSPKRVLLRCTVMEPIVSPVENYFERGTSRIGVLLL
jgi:hypothetical protein